MKKIIEGSQTRRDFILTGTVGIGLLLTGTGGYALAAKKPEAKEEEIGPVEDLMREHGVLRRVLLIYEDALRRLDSGKDLPPETVSSAAGIIRRFIEEYHEKLEQHELFTRFRQAGKLVPLVDVLHEQHRVGRKLTDAVLQSTTSASLADAASQRRLAEALRQFLRMYRPHAAWEDTVLFPAFRSLVSPQEYEDLGEKFEAKEHELFGKDGFENIVKQVSELEKKLGIYDLAQFTPK